MANRDAVSLDRLPRLADVALWVEAAAPALGWQPGAFAAVYAGTRADLDLEAIHANVIGSALLTFLERAANLNAERIWTGTACDLLHKLTELIDEPTRKDRTWPKQPHALSRHLLRIAPNLRRIGIDLTCTHSGDRTMTIAYQNFSADQRPERPDASNADAMDAADADSPAHSRERNSKPATEPPADWEAGGEEWSRTKAES